MLRHFIQNRSEIEQFYGYVSWLKEEWCLKELTICLFQVDMLDIIVLGGREKFAGNERTFTSLLAKKVRNGDLDRDAMTAMFDE